MCRFRSTILLSVTVLLLIPAAALAQPPAESGAVIVGYTGGRISGDSLECPTVVCNEAARWLYPTLVGVDPASGRAVPGGRGALAADWTWSADSRTYTLVLRDDLRWSDGRPVTAEDVLFSFEAAQSLDAPLWLNETFFVEGVTMTAQEPYTLTVRFPEPTCDAPGLLAGLIVLPAHAYDAVTDNAPLAAPTATAGLYRVERLSAGELHLTANPDHPDWRGSRPPDLIYRPAADQNTLVEHFLAGEYTVLPALPASLAAQWETIAASGAQVAEFPGLTWDYLGLNLLDPANPGQPHPLLADVRVRRALQHALDLPRLIDEVLGGHGTAMASYELPGSWAADPIRAPVPYDLEQALDLLKEAGYSITPEGVMVNGAGEPLRFTLLTAPNNQRRIAAAASIAAMIGDLGIAVEVQVVDFTELLTVLETGTFDAFLLSWQAAYPFSPEDQTAFFVGGTALAEGGLDLVGYFNDEVDSLAASPDCDLEARLANYARIQEIVQKDQPYLWLYTVNTLTAAHPGVEGFAPYLAQWAWNIEAWTVNTD